MTSRHRRFARQADGKIVVVGRSVRVSDFRCFVYSTPTVFRLNDDGSLDYVLRRARNERPYTQAHSVALDQKGRIVVAGTFVRSMTDPEGDSELAVLRLQTDGRLDAFIREWMVTSPDLYADASGEFHFFRPTHQQAGNPPGSHGLGTLSGPVCIRG